MTTRNLKKICRKKYVKMGLTFFKMRCVNDYDCRESDIY